MSDTIPVLIRPLLVRAGCIRAARHTSICRTSTHAARSTLPARFVHDGFCANVASYGS
ncbi:MAG: hypothetical protein IH983_04075 [Planctomycetes bacterium]|nr:hypothetical protein [Planctomycetota bacterium]